MSKRRPSHRDRLEKEYLALCEKLRQMQRELDRLESPRLAAGFLERGGRHDALEFVPESKLATPPQDCDEPPSEETPDTTDWHARCTRITSLAIGLLRRVAYAKQRPRLEAFAGLFALGVDGESMRAVARSEKVSLEWVSQKTEEIRERFNLPKNHHNKTDAASDSYRRSAQLQSMA